MLLPLLPLFAQEDRQIAPHECSEWAAADLVRIPKELQPYIRYVALWNQSNLDERIEATAALSVAFNSMGRRSHLQPLGVVDGSKISVLRLNLKDLARDAHEAKRLLTVWEKLYDPYTTVKGEYWPGGIDTKDGRNYPVGRYNRAKNPVQPGPWMGPAWNDLAKWSHSAIPMVNGDFIGHWFMTMTDAQGDLSVPSYADFLGFKNEKEFQRVVAVDVTLAEETEWVRREAVGISGVTRKARAFVFLGKIGGWYYKTLDFKDNRGPRNPLENLGKGIEEHAQATEQIAGLTNGLFAYGLFDLTKKDHPVVDRAPDVVAGSRTLPGNFLAVQNPIGCVDCHRKKALQPIDGWIKRQLTAPLDIFSPDYEKVQELRDQYMRGLDKALEQGRVVYDDAVQELTARAGKKMTAEQYADAIRKMFVRYESPRTMQTAAAYMGTTPGQLRAAMQQRIGQVRATLSLSHLMDGEVPYDIFEDQLEEAHNVLRGYVKK